MFEDGNVSISASPYCQFCRWQYKIFLLTWIEGVLIGFHHLSSVFLGYTPKHWCKLGDYLRYLPNQSIIECHFQLSKVYHTYVSHLPRIHTFKHWGKLGEMMIICMIKRLSKTNLCNLCISVDCCKNIFM